jgi:hypothetical protein
MDRTVKPLAAVAARGAVQLGPAPDFVARRRPPGAAWLLAITGALMFGAVTWQGIVLWQVLTDQDEARARWAALDRPKVQPAAVRSAAMPPAGASTAWRAVDALGYPWPHLLAVVDEATLPGVQWLGLQHQIGQAELRLEGSVPDADGAAALMAALAGQPGWGAATLTRLGRPEGLQAGSGLRFEISVRLAPPSANRALAKR